MAQVSIAAAFSAAVVASACICARSPIRCSTWPSPSTAASRATTNGSLPSSAIVAAAVELGQLLGDVVGRRADQRVADRVAELHLLELEQDRGARLALEDPVDAAARRAALERLAAPDAEPALQDRLDQALDELRGVEDALDRPRALLDRPGVREARAGEVDDVEDAGDEVADEVRLVVGDHAVPRGARGGAGRAGRRLHRAVLGGAGEAEVGEELHAVDADLDAEQQLVERDRDRVDLGADDRRRRDVLHELDDVDDVAEAVVEDRDRVPAGHERLDLGRVLALDLVEVLLGVHQVGGAAGQQAPARVQARDLEERSG